MNISEKLATRRRPKKQKTKAGHYAQTNINNTNKTWTLLQTTGGNEEPNIDIILSVG
jgi:hypothetical protein